MKYLGLLLLFSGSLLCQVITSGTGGGGGATLAGAPVPPKPDSETPNYKPDELCVIEGVVRNAVTGEPLKKASIVLTRVDMRSAPTPPLRTTSTAEGKFAMKAIEPGQYRMSVERPGFVRTEYGAKPGAIQGGTTLTLGKGQAMTSIEFRLNPHSVVTGRVIDADGDPVPHAQVQLVRYRFWQGRKQAMPMGYASTNDLGEYRLFGIAAGKYYLSVVNRDNGSSFYLERSANPQPEEGYAPMYYPGTEDIATASQINVPLGGMLQGIDVTLRKTRTYRVKGKVAGAPRGGNRGGMVMVRPKDSAGMMGMLERNTGMWRGPNGDFEMGGLRPGSYVVEANYFEPPNVRLSGHATVEVTDGNVENVVIALGPGIEVTGSVRVDGENQSSLDNLMIYLQPRSPGPMMSSLSARVKEGGGFTIPQVSQSVFDIRLNGLPPEMYLKSARLGDTDVLEHGLNLEQANSASGLDMVLRPGAAIVTGSVTNEKGDAATGAAVLLRPVAGKPELVRLLEKFVTSDQNGQFKIQGITPGLYQLIAFDGADLMEIQDPELLEEHAAAALKLELKENSSETKTLKAVAVKSQ